MKITLQAVYKPYGLEHSFDGSVQFFNFNTDYRDVKYDWMKSKSKWTEDEKKAANCDLSIRDLKRLQETELMEYREVEIDGKPSTIEEVMKTIEEGK